MQSELIWQIHLWNTGSPPSIFIFQGPFFWFRRGWEQSLPHPLKPHGSWDTVVLSITKCAVTSWCSTGSVQANIIRRGAVELPTCMGYLVELTLKCFSLRNKLHALGITASQFSSKLYHILKLQPMCGDGGRCDPIKGTLWNDSFDTDIDGCHWRQGRPHVAVEHSSVFFFFGFTLYHPEPKTDSFSVLFT